MTQSLRLALLLCAGCTWRAPLLTSVDAGQPDAALPFSPDVFADAADPFPDAAPVVSSLCQGRPKIDAGTGLGEGLLVWYRCEAVNGTTLPDSSGRGHDGKLASGSGAASGPVIAPGKVGNGLDLVYAKEGYVTLPAGLLTDACEATIATWVYINDNTNAWTRLWDFGNDTNTYMFLTPITNTDNVVRFGITLTGNQNEQNLKGKAEVPTMTWVHVAVVLGPMGGELYFNGEVVASNPTLVLRPADLGRTSHNYIGRSQFVSDDPYLDATIDEFRVYDRALSTDEIKALLTVR